MKAKKSLGQHFLRSERALEAIVDAGNLAPGDTILEIGPGEGVLTERLLACGSQVVAVEKDEELCGLLKQRFAEEISLGKLVLIHEDILNFEFSDYKLPTTHYKLIANIPYNITGAIFKKFLSTEYQPETMVLLVQKEVAKRILAQGSKPLDSARGKESILSISVKAYGNPRYVETVKAGSFAPMPKVDSAILAVEGISRDFFQKMAQVSHLEAELPSVEKRFFEILRAGFGSKRKKLSSNLSKLYPKSRVLEVFENLAMDENTRAEDVSIETWGQLAKRLITNQ